ncbi:MAG: rane protein insertase, YidC/Oxa1 family, partial [Clostridia bacterium]|nr:rane protein insertase, YidC/Oxa1 family [Clostridia bacterium]
YKGNTKDPKYTEELQKLYQEEGYNPLSGCLPQLIQLPFILGLWNAIRRPLTYISGLGAKTLYDIVIALQSGGVPGIATGLTDVKTIQSWTSTNEILVAQSISQNTDMVKNVLPDNFTNINMDFFGLNLGSTPVMGFDLTVLIPILSGITSFLLGFISSKINKQPAANNPAAQNMNFIMYFMPLISIWMGFSFPVGVGIYWIFSNILGLVQILILPKFFKDTVTEVKGKEKKLNYNQIVKMEKENKTTDDNNENDSEK